MAKIGTAQIEIKPVLNEEALAEIAQQIEAAVRAAVQAGLRTYPGVPYAPIYPYTTWSSSSTNAATGTGVVEE